MGDGGDARMGGTLALASRIEIPRRAECGSGDGGGGEQAGGFVEAQHQIEILHRLAGRALAQIVDRRDHAQRLRAPMAQLAPPIQVSVASRDQETVTIVLADNLNLR